MKVLLATVVALTAVILCAAADSECERRRLRGRPLHWAHTTDCGRFYRCSAKNVKREIVCPPEREYNAKNGRCVARGKGTCKLVQIAPMAENDNICNGKVSGSYLAKAGYCRDFYVCNNNVATQQSCNASSLFNETTGNCVPDKNSSCWQNKCINVTSGTYLPNNGSCVSFYICQKDQATPQTCNTGSYFNTTNANCIPDQNYANCWENFCLKRKNGELVAKENDCYNYYECLDTKAMPKQCAVGSYFDNLTLQCVLGKCPNDGPPTETPPTPEDGCTCPGGILQGAIVPHPTACNLFYLCYEGELLEQSCLAGNYFNRTMGACARDTKGVCANSYKVAKLPRAKRSAEAEAKQQDEIINEATAIKTKEIEAQSVQTGAVAKEKVEKIEALTSAQLQQDGEQRDSIAIEAANETKCLGLYREGDLVAHPKDCQLFSICYHGELIEQSCGLGNYFDGPRASCQVDNAGVCHMKASALSQNILTAKALATVDIDCTCPGGYSGGDIVPHATDCDKFYICSDGKLQQSECGVGNRFDAASKQCSLDTTGSCWPNNELNCTCPGGYYANQMVPYPNNCRLYYICLNSKLIESDCGSGNRFDAEAQECVLDTCGACNPPANICLNQPNNAMLPHPTQCNAFYLCVNGVAMPETCSAGKRFVPQSGCVLDINAECSNPCENTTSITLMPSAKCNIYYICNNGQTAIGYCAENQGFNKQLQSCIPGGCTGPCTGVPDGTSLAVPNDPYSFYYCMNGVEEQRNCPSGTAYNEKMQLCLLQPSNDCNQQLCLAAENGKIAPTLSGEESSFCACRNGAAYKDDCPTGYTFNTTLNICYSNAPCDPLTCIDAEDYTPFENRNDTNSFCMCVSNVAVIVQCPNQGYYDTNTNRCRQPPTQDPNCNQTFCQSAMAYQTFPSLVSDSRSFCICIDGGATLKKCPEKSKFVAEKGFCVSDAVECNVANCQNPATTFFPAALDKNSFCYCAGPNEVQLRQCPAGTRFDDQMKSCLEDPCDQSVCQDPLNAFKTFATKNNPYVFCYCDNMQAKWRACGTGKVFNDISKTCMPNVPGCDIRSCANATVGNAFATAATDDTHSFCYCSSATVVTKLSCTGNKQFNAQKRICLDTLDTPMCDGKYTQYEAIANPTACNKYNLCFNGNLLDLSCGDGLYFDTSTMQCLPNNNGQCIITQSSTCTCPGGYEEGTFVSHPQDCQKFYICADSALQLADCGDSNYFNKSLGYCMRDTTGVCYKPTTDCTCVGNYREGDLVPNPSDPQLYYVCYNGLLQTGNCGNGQVFDAKQMVCVPGSRTLMSQHTNGIAKRSVPEIYDHFCIEGQKRSVPANCSQYETCQQGNWKRSTCTQQFYYNPEEQLCLEPRDDTVCAYARVTGLPPCNNAHENHVAASRSQHCGSYLRCTHSKWRLMNCPKQHFYSTRLQTCMLSHKNSSSCSELQMPNVTAVNKCMHMQVRAYEPNCAMYSMCLEGEWWMQYCPLGMYFNSTQNYCMPNNAGQCATAELKPSLQPAAELVQMQCKQDGALRASALACEQYYVCVAGMWFPQTCATRFYFNVTQEACVPVDGTCSPLNAPQCVAGSLRAYPLNCTAYMRCSDAGDDWLRFECARNFYFDDVLNECLPNDGSCASSGLRRTCRAGETRAYTKSENCAEFLHCEAHGGWQLGSCLKGYAYVQDTQTCQLSDMLGNCTQSKVLGAPLTNDVTFATQQEENACKDKPDGAAVKHDSDCGRFYLCLNGSKTMEQNCSNGSFFDESVSYCRPNDGSCRLKLNGPCVGQQDGAQVPHADDCTRYYKCSTLNGTKLQQCNSGEYFHSETSSCRQNQGECRMQRPSSICAGKKHGTRLPHETYCNIYYACVRGLAVPIECPDGQKFDEILHRCQHDAERVCQNGTLGSNTTHICGNGSEGAYMADKQDCTRYFICSNGTAQHKRCIAGNYFNAMQLLCVPDDGSCPLVEHQPSAPPDPSVCIDRHGDLMLDPANCNEFYVCINGKLRHERCYEQHFFNATISQCQLRTNENNAANTTVSQDMQSARRDASAYCQQQPTNLSALCAHLEVGATMAEQGDCRRYIVCDEDEIVQQRCRNGESYDSLLGFCRQNDGTCLLENGQRVGVCNGKHGQLARDAENCRGYFVCINGQKISAACAADEYFNKSVNLCKPDTEFKCTNAEKTEEKQPLVTMATALKRDPEEKLCANAIIGQRYVNKEDQCRSFYVCLAGGNVQYERCPLATLFNDKTSNCDDAKFVTCSAT